MTPFSIRLAQNYQIMDLPDARKIHTVQTPRGAGLVLWTGYMLWALYYVSYLPWLCWSATGATVVFLCGYLDDMHPLSPFIRLALHLFAAALVISPLKLPFLTAIVCVVWTAGMTSAYNLIDGINGLCISLFIASAVSLVFLGASGAGVTMASMALGVFCWNFPKAQTFLGDGGSTFLGFMFAAHFLNAVAPFLSEVRLNELILMLLLFGGLPVVDTLVAFSRRIINGKSPFYPDKGHLHHLLMSFTGSAFWAVFCLVIVQVLFLAAGLLVHKRLS